MVGLPNSAGAPNYAMGHEPKEQYIKSQPLHSILVFMQVVGIKLRWIWQNKKPIEENVFSTMLLPALSSIILYGYTIW